MPSSDEFGNRIAIEFEDAPIKPRLAMSDSIAIQQMKELDQLPPSLNTMASWRESYIRKKSRTRSGPSETKHRVSLVSAPSVNNTFWKNGMVFQSLFHELEISFDCLPHGTIGFGQNSLEVHSWVEDEHLQRECGSPRQHKYK